MMNEVTPRLKAHCVILDDVSDCKRIPNFHLVVYLNHYLHFDATIHPALQIDLRKLCKVICLADFLGLECYLDTARTYLVNVLRGKTPQQARAWLHGGPPNIVQERTHVQGKVAPKDSGPHPRPESQHNPSAHCS